MSKGITIDQLEDEARIIAMLTFVLVAAKRVEDGSAAGMMDLLKSVESAETWRRTMPAQDEDQ